MASVPQDVVAATVSAEEQAALRQTVVSFDREQLIWSSGFLAGLAGAAAPNSSFAPSFPATASSNSTAPQRSNWHVFYATETGNSRRVAERLASESEQAGLVVEVHDLRYCRPKSLAKIENAVFVLATHGIGEAPEGTEMFFEFWLSGKAPRLDSLNFSVLALGDSSYADFCEIGKVLDSRLRELGATAIVERRDCDLDFDSPASIWTQQVIEHARESAEIIGLAPTAHLHAVTAAPGITRDAPFSAEILTRQAITGRGSSKDVRHIELDLEESGLTYQPGDSLGVVPTNPPQLVDALLQALDCTGSEQITENRTTRSLRDVFLADKEITILSRPVLDAVASHHKDLQAILDDRDRLSGYLGSRQLIDLVQEFPIDWQPQEFVDALRRLTPRLYSIASSPDANPGEAHLTVAIVDYEKFGRRHWGSASNFLIGNTTHAPIYVEPNDHFRLPPAGATPIIMVGAGTGVAPFRAFVEHRREHGHGGQNWLVFGDRNVSSDFLYQLEWLRYRKEGSLTDLDVAFSRDQEKKIYVQHRLLEKGKSIYDWLERGAHFYVCGDAEHMAADIHNALLSIIQRHGHMSDERASDYVNELRRTSRYQRDVY